MKKIMTSALVLSAVLFAQDPIAQDSEYYVLEAQNGKQWAKDDKSVDHKLAEFKKKNGGKSPNIVYILIDDIGYGDLGMPELNGIRGYSTPNINDIGTSKVCDSTVCIQSHLVPRHV